MKKIIMVGTILCLLLVVLVGCDTESYSSGDGLSFGATILEIHDASALVKTIEGMGFHHVTHVTFGTEELEDIGASVGDVVNVLFTGDILATYPEQVFATSWSIVSRKGDVSGIESIPHVGAAHETNRIVSAMPLPQSNIPLRSIQIGADHGGFGYGAYTLTVHYDFSGDTLDYIPGKAFEQIAASLFDLIENLEAVTFSLVGIEETNVDNYIYRFSISRTSSDAGGGAITSFRGVQTSVEQGQAEIPIEYDEIAQVEVYENAYNEPGRFMDSNFIWAVLPTLEYEHIYHCCADFSTALHGGMAIDGTTGQLTGEYAVLHEGHGPLGRGWVYDPELSLLGFGGIGDYSGIDLRPIDEWMDLFVQWGEQYGLMMVERVDSSVRNVTSFGSEYLSDEAYSGEFAVMYFGTFVTDFIFDGGGTLGGAVLRYDTIPMHKDGKWGMIDRDGNIAIPFVFAHILRIDENTVFARYNGRYGILDVQLTLEGMSN